VGKGYHSRDHVQKLKPRVEQICQELGLQYATEENAGRIYVNLTGGPAQMPEQHHGQYGGGYQQPWGQQQEQQYGGGGWQQEQQYGGGAFPGGQQHYAQHHGGQQHHTGHQQQQQQHHGGQQQNVQMEIEQEVKKALPKIFRMLRRSCCTVM